MNNPIITGSILYLVIFIIIGFFLKFNKGYRKDVFYILSNIKLLYKNYLHWSISKLVLYVYSWLLSLTFSSPFLAVLVLMLYKASEIIKPEWLQSYFVDNKIDYGVVTSLLQRPFLMGGIIGVFIFVFFIFVFSFTYAYFLQQKIYIGYLKNEKIQYITKDFWDFKLMRKYFFVIFWVTLYLFIPIGIAFLYILSLLFLSRYEGIKSILLGENIYYGIFQLILVIILFSYFIYIGIRLSFSYLNLLLYYSEKRSAFSYVSQSLENTKGKVAHIIFIGAPFFFLSIMIDNIFSLISAYGKYFSIILNVIDFFTLAGFSLMIYASIFNIITGNKNSKIVEDIKIEKPLDKEKILEENKTIEKISTSKKNNITTKTETKKSTKVNKTN